ncbi:MAG: hypothetical protein V4687_02105 [Bacteroidota bacterium]
MNMNIGYFQKHLHFNTGVHNFWPIYDAIKKYYPIGLKRTEYAIFFDYPGLKELGDIVADAIHGEENKKFKEWQVFENEIASKFNVVVNGTTMGQAPSYSTEFILEDEQTATFRRVKKIVLAVSLVGKFFAIFGIDESYIKHAPEDIPEWLTGRVWQNGPVWLNHAVNVVTVSPHAEFEPIFNGIKFAVEQQFEGYKLIPFRIHCAIIEGLQVRYSDREECTIFHALFNDKYKLNDNTITRGDAGFGSKDWETENAQDFEIEVAIGPPPPIS